MATLVPGRMVRDSSIDVADLAAYAVPTKLTSEIGAFAFRNKVINGDMRIDQRNAGVAYQVPNYTYTWVADRFLLFTLNNNPAQVIYGTRYTNNSNPEHPYFIRTQVNTAANYTNAPGAIEQYTLQHRIEGLNIANLGWGTPQAKTVTISFWVRSNYTGTYLCNFSSQAAAVVPYPSGARAYPFFYTINQANTWEKKTITIPGDTTPSTDKWFFDNSVGVTVGWSLGVNNTAFQANGRSLNQWYTQSAPTAAIDQSIQSTMMMLHNKPYINGIPPYFDLTGVQLEEGSYATPFEQRPIGTELALCQRYYEKSYSIDIAPGTVVNSYGPNFGITSGYANGAAATSVPLYENAQFKVTKRVNPTVTLYSGYSSTPNRAIMVQTVANVTTRYSINVTGNIASYQNGFYLGMYPAAVAAATPALPNDSQYAWSFWYVAEAEL